MTKRAFQKFERKERDFYPTPLMAVVPLLPHIIYHSGFVEPCCGDGALIKHITDSSDLIVSDAFDIEPLDNQYSQEDALEWSPAPDSVECIITNPPWDRKILHPMIDHFAGIAPTWLLFDSDWMHTMQSIEYMKYCDKIVSVGRVKWFGDTSGFDNCAWYLFDKDKMGGKTTFYGREKG